MQRLTPGQKRFIALLSLLVAVTRWWALSAAVWDADEALFATAVRSYDVVSHHPHPPGFPLYIAAGKLARLLAADEFRALQWVNLVCAALLFPAVFLLGHQLGFSFATAAGGALITAFAPNVWFFGGTAFSDVPSLTLVVFACALLLASRNRPGWRLVAGSAMLAVAAGLRPQNLAVGFIPFVLAARAAIRQSRWRALVGAVVVVMLIVAGGYAGAVMASSSWKEYWQTLRDHQDYISRVDSFRSAARPHLGRLAGDFFVNPFGSRRLGIAMVVLSLIALCEALLRRRAASLLLVLTFGPVAVAAWLLLDYNSASRFSIGYMPLLGILAAEGVGTLARLLPERRREPAIAAGSFLIALGLAVWAMPAIREASSAISPPAAAASWIRDNLPASTAKLYVTVPMNPLAEYMLPEYSTIGVTDERAVPLSAREAVHGYVLAEGATAERSGFNFLRSRTSRLWRLTRPRYFEVSIIPLERRPQFLDGWYEAENEGARTWRWMGRRSLTLLPPQPPPALLRISLGTPPGVVSAPIIRIMLNGRPIEEFSGTAKVIARSYRIAESRAEAPNELVLETTQWVNPKERGISMDARDLGLVLHDLVWQPATSASSPL